MSKNRLLLYIVLVVTIASIGLNYSYYKTNKRIDAEFVKNFDLLDKSLGFYKEYKNDVTLRNAVSIAGTINGLCRFTSFHKKHKLLYQPVAQQLDNVLRNYPSENILKNLDQLSEYLNKIYTNPNDIETVREFYEFLMRIESTK